MEKGLGRPDRRRKTYRVVQPTGEKMETIETRLQRLERQNRIYRNLFILAGLALVAAVSYGATKPVPKVFRADTIEAGSITVKEFLWASAIGADVIEAEEIVVKPESGKGMVAMYLTRYGAGMISIRNSKGEHVLQLRAVESGDGLVEVFVAGKKNTAGDF